MKDSFRTHQAKAGAVGGRATGKRKARGDTAYYKALARKAAAARRLKGRTK